MPKRNSPEPPKLSGIYLLHLSPRYKHAGHYLGFSANIYTRINTHLAGQGVPLIRAAVAAGCQILIARVWPNTTYQDEAHFKAHHKKWSILCPICNPKQSQFLFNPELYHDQSHLVLTQPTSHLTF